MCLIVWIWNKKTWRLHQSARAYQFHGHVGLGRGYTITFQLWAHGLATRWVGHIGYTMEDASFAGKWYARAHKIELQYYGLALGRNLRHCNLPKLKPQSKPTQGASPNLSSLRCYPQQIAKDLEIPSPLYALTWITCGIIWMKPRIWAQALTQSPNPIEAPKPQPI